MRLTMQEVEVWARDFYSRAGEPFKKKVNWTRISRDSGFGTTTLHMQRTRAGLDARVIINIARTFNINPLEELGRIARWQYLASMGSTPSDREILSSLNPRYILREIYERMGKNEPRRRIGDSWDTFHGRFSVWFDVTGGEAAKDRLAQAIDLTSSSAMSARLNSHTKFAVHDILNGFPAAQMDPIYALVLAGYITAEEAGYRELLRDETLMSVFNDELLYMMNKQMRFTQRILADQQANERLINALG